MPGWTNRGKWRPLQQWFQGVAAPTAFYMALCTNVTPPTPATDTMAQLSQLAAGNGYVSGGILVPRTNAGFDVVSEDDPNNRAYAQAVDLVWTASGGTIPISGAGARWAVLTDDNATVNSRQVYNYFDLVTDRSVSSGQTLTLQNCEIRIDET